MGNRIRRHADPFQCRVVLGIDDWLGPYCNQGQGEIWLDLGCGKGELAAGLAEIYQHIFFIGIDVRKKIAEKFFPRFSHIPNLLLFHGNMNLSIPAMMGQRKVHRVLINFPDPCDQKPRFRKRQMVNERLVEGICDILAPGGAVSIKTDRQNLFQEMDDLFRSRLKLFSAPLDASFGDSVLSEWEADCLRKYIPVFSGVYRSKH